MTNSNQPNLEPRISEIIKRRNRKILYTEYKQQFPE